MYLNQSADFQYAYNNYLAAFNDYVDKKKADRPPEEIRKSEEWFYNIAKPTFITAIETRHEEIDKELKDIEKKLKIQDEKIKTR